VLAGVVAAAPGRIVAVVGGQHAEIVGAHRLFDFRQSRVERLEAGGEAGDVAAVAEHFGLTPAALQGNGREKTVSLARAIAMYLTRRHTGMSFPEIGRALGIEDVRVVLLGKDSAEFQQTLTDALASGKLVLIIARRPCVLAAKNIREYEKNPLARKEVAP